MSLVPCINNNKQQLTLTEVQLLNKQLFLTVEGLAPGSHPLATVGVLQIAASPEYCLARASTIDVVIRNISNLRGTPPSDLMVDKCIRQEGAMHRFHFEFELVRS